MFMSKARSGILTVLCVVAAGCDPVRTTMQDVLFKVTRPTSGEPVAGARVSVRYDYERDVPPAEQRPESERPTYEWFSGTTDQNGQANVGVVWTVLDRTIWGKPPSWRDWVSGRFYLVKVAGEQMREVLSLVMKPGASAEGQAFAVRVADIQAPRYTKTEEW